MQTITDILGRLVGFISVILMAVGFFMLMKQMKKANRMRPSSLLISMVFSIVMLLFNVLVLKDAKISWWYVFFLLFGAGFGFAWGTSTVLNIQENKVIGKRSVLYIYFWLASLAVTQVLAFFAKTSIVAIGLSGMFFSTGASLGTNSNILYRMKRLLPSSQKAPVFNKVMSKKTSQEKIHPDKIKKKKKFPKFILGLFTGLLVLSISVFLLIRFGVADQIFPINLKIGDNLVTLNSPNSGQGQEVQKTQDDLSFPAAESAPDENLPKPQDSSSGSPSDEEVETPQDEGITENSVIFLENFNSDGGVFPLYSEQYMRYFRSEGLGIIESTTHIGMLPIMVPELKVRDLIAEFDFMMPEAKDDSRCGFIFRSDTEISDGLDEHYALFLYPKINTVKMSLWKENTWNHSQTLKPDPPLNIGYENNHVRMEIKGESMKVYLNGTFLADFSEQTLQEPGLIGLFLYPSASIPEGKIDYVYFDNLQVFEN